MSLILLYKHFRVRQLVYLSQTLHKGNFDETDEMKNKKEKNGGNEVDKKGKGKEETVADLLEAKKQNCHCYK